MQPSKFYAVNWVDGMKITKEHLIQQENYFTDALRDAAASQLNNINYGLISPISEIGRSINLKISVDPSKIIKVNLSECHAITRGGARIEIAQGGNLKNSSDEDKLAADYDFSDTKEKAFYVVLTVNLFARLPYGQPEADEVPPRYPFVAPQYTLDILPESQVNDLTQSQYLLIIGKLRINSGRMQVVDRFIPPCTLASSHSVLHEAYYNLGNQLGETANLNTSIVQKANAKSSASSLVKSFLILSEKVADFLTNELGRYRWIVGDMPPAYTIEPFVRFAYLIKICLDRLPPKDKEELISYFSEWMEMSAAEIMDKVTAIIKSEYNHNDILDSLTKAEDFMLMIHTLFTKLNSLDFIGKKKGERAFVQERTFEEVREEEPENKSKKKWGNLMGG